MPGDNSNYELILVSELLVRCGTPLHEIKAYTEAFLEGEDLPRHSEPRLTKASKRMVAVAFREALRRNSSDVDLGDLLIALLTLQRGDPLAQMFQPLGLTSGSVRAHLNNLRKIDQRPPSGSPLEQLSVGGKRAIDAAHAAMRASYCGRISTAHLLLGVLADEENLPVTALRESGVDMEELRAKARQAVRQDGELATPQHKFTSGAKRALERARVEAQRLGQQYIGAEHILLALESRPTTWEERLRFGPDVEDDATQTLATLEAGQLRRAIYRVLGFEGLISPVTPSSKKRQKRVNWLAFMLTFGWNMISPLMVILKSKQSAEDVLTTNGIVFMMCGIIIFLFSIIDRDKYPGLIGMNIFAGCAGGCLFARILLDSI